ncbi:Gelsolin [Frankliniella fusca]|uniref:Gelsolin n=1 Tax=Frankliniella fusca TaxID=407009 RepID=A0AAE1I417_9NEOP|nr:Gelsolin [Frankliniella fusca]
MMRLVQSVALAVLLAVLLAVAAEALPAKSTAASPASPSRSSSPARPGSPGAAFGNAGKKAGLEIWRVENFAPVPYPKNDYGKFYSGDSYILLNTRENRGTFSWDIFFWLGKETSQDESGAAAILSVELDDALGGSPVQHREIQDHESKQFLDLFKSGVRYLPGGVSSGFHHVTINADSDKKLYQVKGKRNVRVRQVYADISSMNKGDCFILDTGKGDILVFVGAGAKRVEKIKATQAANMIRDQDHHGRAKVSIIDEFSPAIDVENFFKALGTGAPNKIPDESAGGDDADFEKQIDNTVVLYKVSDATGSLKVDKLAQKPLSQSELSTNDAFILDAGASGIYVWVGRKSTKDEKLESMKKGEKYLADNKYPSWTKIQRVVEGSEPAGFKQYFGDWRG